MTSIAGTASAHAWHGCLLYFDVSTANLKALSFCRNAVRAGERKLLFSAHRNPAPCHARNRWGDVQAMHLQQASGFQRTRRQGMFDPKIVDQSGRQP